MKVRASVAGVVGVLAVLAASTLLLRGEPVMQRRLWLPVVMSDNALVVPPPVLRGAAMPWQYQVCSDVAQLDASWWYNWRTARRGCDTPGFIPMVWGRITSTPVLTDGGQWLLGFNEPDNPGQAHMTPEEAAALWPLLVATGRKLASPATMECEWCTPGYLDATWLQRFMTMVDTDTVSIIATHYYGCSPDRLRTHLAGLWVRYRKPIWVTEMGCAWGTPEQMRAMLGGLGAYHVERVAWFATRTPDWPWLPPLVADDGTLTELGREYGLHN